LKHRVPLPSFAIDRACQEPLHRQLAGALRRAIRAGDLPPGAALPSTRWLAQTLGLSRNTVITAYDELMAEGLLVARTGSATRVTCEFAAPRDPAWDTPEYPPERIGAVSAISASSNPGQQ
jgi:GntR family transcriptional regulator/MocR family aminotransferase